MFIQRLCSDCAVKYNNYLEVPRELDMEPYTVDGFAKVEGERVDVSGDERENTDVGDENNKQCTQYSLAGVVVHSGDARRGCYYSFIKHRFLFIKCYLFFSSVGFRLGEGGAQWYKFLDNEVSEAKLDDDEVRFFRESNASCMC